MPKINRQNKPSDPEEPSNMFSEPFVMVASYLTPEDEKAAWEAAEHTATGLEVYYTRAKSLEDFTPDKTIWEHLRGQEVHLWLPTADPAEPFEAYTGWVVLANDTGLLLSDGNCIEFFPWTSVARLGIEADNQAKNLAYDYHIAEMQKQREPEAVRVERERRRWSS
jgi:hypothetical protein